MTGYSLAQGSYVPK